MAVTYFLGHPVRPADTKESADII